MGKCAHRLRAKFLRFDRGSQLSGLAGGHGAFFGLVSGTLAAAFHHGVTLGGDKGGWLVHNVLHTYPSEMAQNFWTAIYAWVTCFLVTVAISLFTTPRPEDELKGLVYSLTERPQEDHLTFWQRPATLAVIVLLMAVALNLYFY